MPEVQKAPRLSKKLLPHLSCHTFRQWFQSCRRKLPTATQIWIRSPGRVAASQTDTAEWTRRWSLISECLRVCRRVSMCVWCVCVCVCVSVCVLLVNSGVTDWHHPGSHAAIAIGILWHHRSNPGRGGGELGGHSQGHVSLLFSYTSRASKWSLVASLGSLASCHLPLTKSN